MSENVAGVGKEITTLPFWVAETMMSDEKEQGGKELRVTTP